MASAPIVAGADGFGVLPPSYTRSGNPDLTRRPSYCHAAFALKQIAKVTENFLRWRAPAFASSSSRLFYAWGISHSSSYFCAALEMRRN